MTAVAREERTFSEVKRLCYAGLDGPELLRAAVERLRRTVPFEAYCASVVDPASGLVTRSLAEEMGGAREAAIFFERLYFEHDMDQFKKMAEGNRPVVLASETAGGSMRSSPRYRELLGPLGLAHEMRGVLTAGGYMWGSMDLVREKGRPDFSLREAELLRRLAPHLGNGLKTAALRAHAPAERSDIDVPGVLTLNRRGQVVQYTPAAVRWLRELEDLGEDWREWTGLPTAVRTVDLALKRALKSGSERYEESMPRLRARARSGRWLVLYGSLAEATPEWGAETIIVIEPAKPEDVLPFNMAAYSLSKREEEIVGLVVRGASTRQISENLFISEYTVQNHLSNVFEKVGVRGRRALVKQLFVNNLYPTLFG